MAEPGAPSATSIRHPMAPVLHRVVRVEREAAGVVTIDIGCDEPLASIAPGQFTMLYAFGVGEAPVSVSGCPSDDGVLRHTVRAAGAVTAALCRLAPGDTVGVRGPFGTGWPIDGTAGSDLLVVAGGIGLAPLRPAVRRALVSAPPRRVSVVVGARSPADLLYRDDLDDWSGRGARVAVTVDAPTRGWPGEVGTVVAPMTRLLGDRTGTVALLCGPEVMMRVAARELALRGVDPARILVSLERNMHCAIGQCGHCQLGPAFVCTDGPVLPWSVAAPLLEVRRW